MYAPLIDAAHVGTNFIIRLGDHEVGFAWVGPLNSTLRRAGGEAQLTPLVLRRAVSRSLELWDWHQAAAAGAATRDVTIELLDASHREVVARWVLRGARPVRWTGPALDASGHEVAMEEIEVAYDRLEWQSEV